MAAGPSSAKRRRSHSSTSVTISACGEALPSSASARDGASGSSGSMRATSIAASAKTARTASIAPVGPRPKLRRGTVSRSSSGCEAASRGECSSPLRTNLKRCNALRNKMEVRTPSFTSRRTSSPSRAGRRSHHNRAGRSPRARSASATSRMSGATESGRGSSTTASSHRVRKRSKSASSMGCVQPRSRTGTRPSKPNSPRMCRMATAEGPTAMNAIGSRSPGLGSAATRLSSRRRTTRNTSSPSGVRAPRRARNKAATCSTRSVIRLARNDGESNERSTVECATIAAMRGPAFASRNACSMPSRNVSMPLGATTGKPNERAACHGDANRTKNGLSSKSNTTPPSSGRELSSARRAALMAMASCSLGMSAKTRFPSLAARTAKLTARALSTESVTVT